MKKKALMLILMLVFTTNTVFASEGNWKILPGNYKESALLPVESIRAEDRIHSQIRGEYISTGILEIKNQKNGTIYISVDTLAHLDVDRIRHTVFLDRWNERTEAWDQIDSWTFEKTKEEEGGKLSMMTDSFTLTGLPTNHYYRARGLHMVEIGDEIEGCATETDGVLITKD